MRLLQNSGTDRVIDELRRGVSAGGTLDVATPALPGAEGDRSVVEPLALTDDVAKSNLTAVPQQHGLENVRSL